MTDIDCTAIISRVDQEPQQRKIEALLAALRSIAAYFEDDPAQTPDETYWPDCEYNYSKQEHWDRAFNEGERRGKWVLGEVAQTAIDEWELP